MKLEFSQGIFEKGSNSMKIRPVRATLFRAAGQTDRHDEDNRFLLQF